MLAPKWPPKWRQKVIEFWLRWNCHFCYPSHAKSTFSLSRTPPKMMQNLYRKRLCNQTPPKIFNFQPQGASGWQHESKRLPKGFLLGGREHQKQPWGWKLRILGGLVAESFFFWRDLTLQNRPSFSLNGCQNGFPKRFKLTQNPFKRDLSKRLQWNKLGEVTNTFDD